MSRAPAAEPLPRKVNDFAPLRQGRTQAIGRFVSRAPLADRPMLAPGDVVAAGQILAFLKTGILLRPLRTPVAGLRCTVHRKQDEVLGFGDLVFEIEAR